MPFATPATAPASVKTEIRENLLDRLRSGETAFPGIVGFDDTVLPAARERAARRPRPGPARRARPGQDPADAHDQPAARRVDARSSRAARSTTTRWRRSARAAAGSPPSSATSCRSPGSTATSGTSRSSPPRTPASATWSATSTRSRSRRAARSATPRRCTTACCRAPTAASSASTSCPTSPSASRSRCSTCSRSATSRSAATPCGCRSTCSWWRQRQPRGLHQPRPDHHPAQGPVRRRDPHPLPARGRAEEVELIAQEAGLVADVPEHLLEVVARLHPRAARVAVGRPPLRGERPVRDRRCRGRRRLRAAPRRPGRRGRRRRPGLRRADRRPDAARQGRVRDGRGGPRGRGRRSTCCGWRSPRRSAPGWSGSTCPASPSCSPRARRSRPASWCPAAELLDQVGTVPGPVQGARPARARRRRVARARWPPRSSSCSRACT